MHAIDLAIGSNLDLHLTLKVFIEQVVTQLGVDAADALLLNPRAHRLEYSTGQGFPAGSVSKAQFRLDE